MSDIGDPKENAEEKTSEEGFTRRVFLTFLMGVSTVMTVTPFAPMIEFFFKKPEKTDGLRKKVANVNDVAEGSTAIIFYPGEETEDRTFLVHLTPEEVEEAVSEGRDEFITDGFVAFNSICPHLQCPVGAPEGTPEEDEFVCPCHGGVYNKFDGTVLFGPPPAPLPAVTLEIDKASGDIYATGMIGKVGRGRV
jgi:menaquinol-cytochrome c reductase iron-sulfur subunit